MLLSALAWPMEKIAARLVADEGGVDFTRPPGEPAIVGPDSVSWQVFRNPVTMFVGGVAAVLDLRQGLPGAERSDTRGGVAAMTALLAVGLIGVSALAVDVGVWEVNKSGLQGAADQAVLAASLAASSGNIVMTNEAKGIAAAHGFVNGTDDVTVTLNKPPATGAYAGVATAIEVVITQQQKSFLSGVVNNFSAPVASASSRSAARRGARGTRGSGGARHRAPCW